MSALALGRGFAAGRLGSGSLMASLFGGGDVLGGGLAGAAMAGAIGDGGLAAAGGPPGAGRVLDFRRRGAPPRRRRRSPLLALGKPLGIAAATVALPLALAAWLLTSRQFQLHRIVVDGPASSASPARPARPASSASPLRPASSAAMSRPASSASSPRPARSAPPSAPPALAAMAPAAAPRVPAAWVREALAPLVGRNLLRLPLAEVRLRLAANPWIAAVEVAKELPDRLRVTVAERRPEVLLRLGAALLYADAAGRPIAPAGPRAAGAAGSAGAGAAGTAGAAEAAGTSGAAGAAGTAGMAGAAEAAASGHGLLVVSLPPALLAGPRPPVAAAPGSSEAMTAGSAAAAGVAGALRLAAQLRLLRPEWTPSLSQIDVVDEDDFQLHIAALPCPLLVRGSRLADNLVRFEQLLPELRRRYPALAAVDLRYSRRIVVQPARAATATATAAAKAKAAIEAAPPPPPSAPSATSVPASPASPATASSRASATF